MTTSPLISVSQLHALLASGAPCMVFDCSFDLQQPDAGRQQYLQAHIPGAVHADIHTHLSAGPGEPAVNGGRHPLPTRQRLAQWLSSSGFDNRMQAVVYDRQGSSFCGRLWWMLKWLGHDAVYVLDGGLPLWQNQGHPVHQGEEPTRAPTQFALHAPLRTLVLADEVQAALNHPDTQTLIDARAPERYRGETEPLDPVAGHIPTALNRPYGRNLGMDGRFKPAELLRAEFEALLAGRDPNTVVHHCGSGITALPNLIAMEIAGFAPTRLFAGSWSEWCSVPGRPVA